jgi:hypothetical protein
MEMSRMNPWKRMIRIRNRMDHYLKVKRKEEKKQKKRLKLILKY